MFWLDYSGVSLRNRCWIRDRQRRGSAPPSLQPNIYIVRSTLNPLIGRQMRRSKYARYDRAGVSLLETVLAVSILAAALAALGHQTFTGLRASVRAELETRAALLCQSRMETLIHTQDMTLPISREPIPDAPDWRWSAQLQPVPDVDGLQWLIVSVVQPGPQAALSQYSLVRLISAEGDGRGDRP